ncbi:hypothetical protein H2198_006766 [Neophaeococcomyces mojaviensis]|uniref:Uncharacterized protein n=1 Tax=Neophaeococcomyces mojaviensis TaxID=3383035 RepID=A0ACC3A1W8_9EURO|nr:hypothetical protein H2198_006766 [Knufia sp. JES_112]
MANCSSSPNWQLDQMIIDKDLDGVKSLLGVEPDLLNCTLDYLRQTPLIRAAQFQALNIVKYLLEAGAEQEHTDDLGRNFNYFITPVWPAKFLTGLRDLIKVEPSTQPSEERVKLVVQLLEKAETGNEKWETTCPDPIEDCYLTMGDLSRAAKRQEKNSISCTCCGRSIRYDIWVSAVYSDIEYCDSCFSPSIVGRTRRLPNVVPEILRIGNFNWQRLPYNAETLEEEDSQCLE